MMLLEHAAKEIFSGYGIPVPQSTLITDAADAKEGAMKLGKVVLKAQVVSGGRGKAGGILKAENPQEAVQNARRILGMSIRGNLVKKLLVEEYIKPEKEMYLGITIDRKARCPVIMASSEGGIDIEEVAGSSPEKIKKMHIDPLAGLHDYQVRRLADFLDKGNMIPDIIKKLYRIFTDQDCMLAEINPLALTAQGVMALDAKMVIDDNAMFRQKFIEEEEDTLSAAARKNGMSYVGLDGDIGCIVNGAGLAMATLDMISEYGGKAANFMDVRAGANEEQMKIALQIVSSNRNVKVIMVNIFGGLTKCDEAARAIIDFSFEKKIPLVIRLAGTNEAQGRNMLEKSGMTLASSTQEAAKEAVRLGNSH